MHINYAKMWSYHCSWFPPSILSVDQSWNNEYYLNVRYQVANITVERDERFFYFHISLRVYRTIRFDASFREQRKRSFEIGNTDGKYVLYIPFPKKRTNKQRDIATTNCERGVYSLYDVDLVLLPVAFSTSSRVLSIRPRTKHLKAP